MKNQEKKRLGRRAVALLAVCGVLILAAIYICCVRNGYILLNHPSRKRYPVRGVDVSHYQGTIDWEELEDQGVEFCLHQGHRGQRPMWTDGLRKTGRASGRRGLRPERTIFSALTARRRLNWKTL